MLAVARDREFIDHISAITILFGGIKLSCVFKTNTMSKINFYTIYLRTRESIRNVLTFALIILVRICVYEIQHALSAAVTRYKS